MEHETFQLTSTINLLLPVDIFRIAIAIAIYQMVESLNGKRHWMQNFLIHSHINVYCLTMYFGILTSPTVTATIQLLTNPTAIAKITQRADQPSDARACQYAKVHS